MTLWEKYKLRFYDLSVHMDDAKQYILYFSLEGSEDDIRLYTNEDEEWNLLYNELDRCGNEYIDSLQKEKI